MFNWTTQIQTKVYEGFGGNFFDSDMLAAAYDSGKPHIFDKYMGQLFSSTDRFNGKPLIGMTQAKGKMIEIDNEINDKSEGVEIEISKKDSKAKVLIVKTDEMEEIAKETLRLSKEK